MAGESRWIFTRTQLVNTPSRKYGIDSDKELNYRQQTANFIQDMGQRLQVTQLCINTAIVYMHRFYMFHSFTKFSRNSMAAACLFLGAKVEEQPRKLEHVIKVGHMCLHREAGPLDMKSEPYLEQAQELVVNENILLQTLGFDITVDHPHTHVVKTCTLVRASKDLAQTSYFLATNSLHLTNMCLQYKPTVVACVCIHLACKWSNWEIPRSSEGREWFWYTDREVTMELLEELTQDFLTILDKCPSKLKKKILTWKMSLFQSGRGEGGDISVDQPPPPLKKSVKVESASASASTSGSLGPTVNSAANWSSSEAKRQPSRKEAPLREAHGSQPSAAAGVPDPSGASTSIAAPSSAMPPAADHIRLSDAGMRRVKTEPVLTTLTPKEYRERRERERQAAMHGQGQPSHQVPLQEKPQPAHEQAHAESSEDAKDRHHMDIFSHTPADGEKPARQEGAHMQHGRSEHARSRERPHGELHRSQGLSDHHRSGRAPGNDRERPHDQHRSRDQHRNKELSQGPQQQQHRPTAPPPLPPPASHSEPNPPELPQEQTDHHQADHHSNTVDHSLSNNGHGGFPSQNKADNVHRETQSRNIKQENPSDQQSRLLEVSQPQDTGNKDLKIKLNLNKSQDVSPSTERKDLKMKIKLPGHSSSPVTSGEGLKLKLDLKNRHPNDERHSHSRSSSGDHSSKAEYQLSNQGSNPLKLVLSKGKVSGESPVSAHKHHRSSHHHHHSSGRSGSEKSHSRKRPHGSPQDAYKVQAVAGSRGHSSSHGHPSKMSRNDSFSNDAGLRLMNSWGGLEGVPANGSHSGSPALLSIPNTPTVANMEKTKRQLQQLIDLKQAQLGMHPVGVGGMPSANAPFMLPHGDQPPLPPMLPNSDAPPPPPPPTEPPPLPHFPFI